MQKLLIVKPDDAQFIDSPETFLVDYSIELSGHLPLPSALAVYQLVIIHEAFLAHCQPVLQQCTSLNIPCFLFWKTPNMINGKPPYKPASVITYPRLWYRQ